LVWDIILLFADRNEVYFIAGLVAFVLSHIAYILLFNTQIKPKTVKKQSCFLDGRHCNYYVPNRNNCPIVAKPGDLTIPVFIYALVLSTMLLFAFKGFLMWKKPANWYILIGAVLFVQTA
jgi:uncharacterized membrane protein YhhN